MRDTDVFELDVELGGALHEVVADTIADGFTLGDEFGGVELRDDGFEDFVADGREDALIVVLAEVLGGISIFLRHNSLKSFGCSLDRSWVACQPPVDARLSVSSSPFASPCYRSSC